MESKELIQLANDLAVTQKCIEDLRTLGEAISEKKVSITCSLSARILNPEPVVNVAEDGSLVLSDRPQPRNLIEAIVGPQEDPDHPMLGGLRNISDTLALTIIGALLKEAEERMIELKKKLKALQ